MRLISQKLKNYSLLLCDSTLLRASYRMSMVNKVKSTSHQPWRYIAVVVAPSSSIARFQETTQIFFATYRISAVGHRSNFIVQRNVEIGKMQYFNRPFGRFWLSCNLINIYLVQFWINIIKRYVFKLVNQQQGLLAEYQSSNSGPDCCSNNFRFAVELSTHTPDSVCHFL